MDRWFTASTAPTAASGTLVDLDLRDEGALLCADRAENDLHGTRSALAALRLAPVAGAAHRSGPRFDHAVFAATGDRHLATLFGRATRRG